MKRPKTTTKGGNSRALDADLAHLRAETRAWLDEAVLQPFVLEPHHRALAILAAEARDRGIGAREGLAKHGQVYTNRFGEPRPRPEVGIARDSAIVFARLMRELGLDVEAPADDSRAPAIRGKAGLRVAS